MLWGRHLHIET